MTRLPPLTWQRRCFRRCMVYLSRLLLALLARVEITGLESFPTAGPALIVFNHQGDPDVIVGLARLPSAKIHALAKIDLFVDYPWLGRLMDWYGVIWVHRGLPDRRALRVALQALEQGLYIAIAPEGRESLTGGLEEGTHGAAYLALKSGVAILPVGLIGTSNRAVFGSLKHFQRPQIAIRVGKLFHLNGNQANRQELSQATQQIMESLAALLPEEYQGFYRK
jgi:1-acyl-sn-glycerol-3-phosphate acyltransferase